MSDINEEHKFIMIFREVHCNKSHFPFILSVIYATASQTEQAAQIYIIMTIIELR